MSEILVEVMRGDILESLHRGSVAVVNSDGKLLHYIGDPFGIVSLRSSAKPFQALNSILTGAADRYSFTDKELALICASHYGEPFHREVARGMLDKMGLTPEHLLCVTNRVCVNADHTPEPGIQRLSSDCSGKHCGFLAACLHQGFDAATYDKPENPLQRQILEVIIKMTGAAPEKILLGEDGCGVPVHGMPLYNMALGYARLANPGKLEPEYKLACERVTGAMNSAPEMVAGTGGFCTELIAHTHGKLVGKLGAEAVYGVGLIGRDMGIAVKIDDGNAKRAISSVVMEALRHLDILEPEELEALSRFASPVGNINSHNRVVGEIRTAFRLIDL